ncbi:DUF2867 domain-containing protein [Streptomyces mirabilis]|uniref:DUF2867 domain-containing protein n=1 Tax=Streptomyces mirabilis TaxID=68239 RepID=UPI003323AEB2
MRLPTTAHTSRPWRSHEIAPDFRVEDVWALPTPGGPDDLAHLVRQFAKGEQSHTSSPGYRLLWAARWKLGAWFGWDHPDTALGARERSLRDCLPEDLRRGARGPDHRALPLTSVYQTHDEWAAETANGTGHSVLHIGWVLDEAVGYRGQMAVLVKPNGLIGTVYMAAVKPFRVLVLYPQMLRSIGREWQSTAHLRR